MSRVLVTGAAGYIGSHVVVDLLNAGHEVVGIDNFQNSQREVLSRIEQLAGAFEFVEGDIRDRSVLERLFATNDVSAVIHFAGLKSVSESVRIPLSYYDLNVGATTSLLGAMSNAEVHKIVFSSSCTVYGDGDGGLTPIVESSTFAPTNPYGHSKAMAEQVLTHAAAADPQLCVLALRYFNPAGAHQSGILGESPLGVPQNLFPRLTRAILLDEQVPVCGTDYDTPDGTCIRDYIHISDLSSGHLAALDRLVPGFEAVNLGTGIGSSVFDVVRAMERASGQSIDRDHQPRRAGDAVALWADPARALQRLGWKAECSLDDMCRDHWLFQSMNPNGYV